MGCGPRATHGAGKSESIQRDQHIVYSGPCSSYVDNRVIQIKILAIQLESGFFGYLKMAVLKLISNCCHGNKSLNPNLLKCRLIDS